jgi:hypothetical protein
MNPRVVRVRPRASYRLEITFSNGEVGLYDCRPLLDFGVFQELRDLVYFNQVSAAGGTVVWPHEQDICPDTLYADSQKVRPPRPRTLSKPRGSPRRRQTARAGPSSPAVLRGPRVGS